VLQPVTLLFWTAPSSEDLARHHYVSWSHKGPQAGSLGMTPVVYPLCQLHCVRSIPLWCLPRFLATPDLLASITGHLHQGYSMTYLEGSLIFHLDGHHTFIVGDVSILMLLCGVGTLDSNSCATPLNTWWRPFTSKGSLVVDLIGYRSLADGLECIIMTCPDIAHDNRKVCLYMHEPRNPIPTSPSGLHAT
jgi:hypothetical protein